jgi:hypothetical protein
MRFGNIMKGFDELWLDGSPGNADEAAMLESTFDDKGLRALPVLERATTVCNYRSLYECLRNFDPIVLHRRFGYSPLEAVGTTPEYLVHVGRA